MARTIAQVKQQIIDEKDAQSGLSGLNSTSQTSIFNLIAYIIAACIVFFENILDLFKVELETIADAAVPGTPQWLQDMVFKFQYDASTPEIAELDTTTFKITYPTVDENKRVISRCSVKTDNNKVANVKVATLDPPEALDAGQLAALQSYVNLLGYAGVQANVTSLAPDQLQVSANIYYDGQYSATIQTAVEAAINAYLASLPFDGTIKASAVQDAIQAVAGVKDVVVTGLQARADNVAFGSGTILIASSQELIKSYQTISGYIIEETTGGQTFADTLTYIVE